MTAAWLVYVAVATYRWEKANTASLPPPSIYLASTGVFAVLGLIAQSAPGPATAFAWGLVVAADVAGVFGTPVHKQVQTKSKQQPQKAGA